MQWKAIKDYKNYLISNTGVVLSKKRNKLVASKSNGRGYLQVGIRKDNNLKLFYVHRLVAEAFLPNPQNKCDVNHKDGNKANNNVSNLEWATRSENIRHSFDNGLQKKKFGSENPMFGKTKSLSHRAKVVVNAITNEKYLSVKDAAEKTGFTYSSLTNMLNGHRLNKTSLRYVQ